MKTIVVALIVGIACPFVGWYRHAWLNEPQNGVQWKFSDAAFRGDINELERLLKRGAAINETPVDSYEGIQGFPALFVAAQHGEADAVRRLLDHGANTNQPSSDGGTPLGAAEYHLTKVTETVQILKAHGGQQHL
jgi:Ankyrin repeats (3 copies)